LFLFNRFSPATGDATGTKKSGICQNTSVHMFLRWLPQILFMLVNSHQICLNSPMADEFYGSVPVHRDPVDILWELLFMAAPWQLPVLQSV